MTLSSNIRDKAAKSVIWSFAEKISVQGVGFVIGLILARLLMPEDYGVIAILYIFISVATVFIDGGFSNALIQNQERTEKDFSTAFYTNVGIAILCYLLLYIAAPYMAEYFKQPLLKNVTRVYGISIVISSVSLVQKSRYYINYNFRIIALISLGAILFGGIIAIIMAYNGSGVWTLVWYYLIVETIRTVCLWILGKWSPSEGFSTASFIRIFNFGSKLLGANMLNVIASNIYTFVIGKMFDATSLGFYSRGQSMSYIIPSNFSNIMTQAGYPVLCEVQNDQEKLRLYFSKYIKISFAVLALLMVLLASLAFPIVSIILTDKWLPCVPIIQILAIGYMFDPVMRLNANVINVTGHSEYSFHAELYKKIALLIILIVTSLCGLTAMVWGLAVYNVIDLIIVSFYVKRVVGLNFIQEMRILSPIMLYAMISYSCVYMVTSFIANAYIQIIMGTIIGIITYIAMIIAFSRNVFSDICKIFK